MSRSMRRRAVVWAVVVLVLVGLSAVPVGAGEAVTHPKWSRPVQLSNDEYRPAQRPVLDGNREGGEDRLLAAWSTEGRAYVRWSRDGGGTWKGRVTIGRGVAPSVIATDSGATVAWYRDGTIYTSRYDGTHAVLQSHAVTGGRVYYQYGSWDLQD